MATKSHALLNFPYGPFDVHNVFICGACVQVFWGLKISDVFKLMFVMEVSDGETPDLVLGITLF